MGEKHKDYVKRARDYNEKKEALRVMKEKAALKNPDEFYFHMENAHMKDDKLVNVKEANEEVPDERLKILKPQDLAYLTTETQKEAKKIEKMQNELQFIGVVKPKSHIVFVDSDEDIEEFDAAEYFDTDPALVGRFYNRPRKCDLEEME